MASLYSVTYNTNNSTGGTTPPTQSATSDSTSYSFIAPTPDQYGLVKDGYTFMGWAESPSAVFEDYKANTTIELSNTNPTKTLYAVWGKNYTYQYSTGEGSGTVPANGIIMLGNLPYTFTPNGTQADMYRLGYAPNGWNSITFTAENPSPTATPLWTTNITASNITTLQDISTNICSNITQTGKQLFDTRDGKKYWVAKLADDNCWMTQNLAIDLTGKTLTASDSDVTNSWSPVSAWGTNNNTVAWQISTTGSEHTSYGGYYTWQAATANTAPANTGTAPGSICPKGWRLPTGNTGEFQALVNKGASGWVNYPSTDIPGYWLGGNGNVAGAAFFPASGFVNNGSLGYAGNQGRYWSSTAYDTNAAYSLRFTSSSGADPSRSYARYYGLSVRCVAR